MKGGGERTGRMWRGGVGLLVGCWDFGCARTWCGLGVVGERALFGDLDVEVCAGASESKKKAWLCDVGCETSWMVDSAGV